MAPVGGAAPPVASSGPVGVTAPSTTSASAEDKSNSARSELFHLVIADESEVGFNELTMDGRLALSPDRLNFEKHS